MRFEYNPLAAGIEEIRGSWGWFLALGILFVLLGAVCVIGDVGATFATVLVFGWMLLFSGIFGLVHAFRTHSEASANERNACRRNCSFSPGIASAPAGLGTTIGKNVIAVGNVCTGGAKRRRRRLRFLLA